MAHWIYYNLFFYLQVICCLNTKQEGKTVLLFLWSSLVKVALSAVHWSKHSTASVQFGCEVSDQIKWHGYFLNPPNGKPGQSSCGPEEVFSSDSLPGSEDLQVQHFKLAVIREIRILSNVSFGHAKLNASFCDDWAHTKYYSTSKHLVWWTLCFSGSGSHDSDIVFMAEMASKKMTSWSFFILSIFTS